MNQTFPLIIEKDNTQKNAIHFYADVDQDKIQQQTSYLSNLPYVKSPIILLTDFHNKPMLETPSSSVIVTQNCFSLALTSPSQNCGMSLIRTPIFSDDLSPSFIEQFISGIKSAIPLMHQTPVISNEEVYQSLKRGANWAIEKFQLSEEILNYIENKGNLFSQSNLSLSEIENAIPDEIIGLVRRRFGIIGGGNHFLELQIVDEIINDNIAKAWGLKQNQMVIMFHTGSDVLGAYLGRLYAYRRKTSFLQHLQFYRRKIRHHFTDLTFKSIGKRFSYYFMPKPFRFIDPHIQEGKRVLLTVNCAANFGFANRLAIFSTVRHILRQVSADQKLEVKLLYDCSHNSIYKENLNGNAVWAHRHNACRVYPPSRMEWHPTFSITGQPAILPGTNQTSSYICAGQEGAASTHFTVDHGLGAIQKHYEMSGSPKKTGEYSLLFNYEKDSPERIPILVDTAVDGAVEILNRANIICPIARLKPIATLKGPKPKII